MSRFTLSEQSLHTLHGVHPDLVMLVKHAITISAVAFEVGSGVRSTADQRALVRIKASRSMRSKHLIQQDGFGHAVDLIAYVNGQISVATLVYNYIATAIQAAVQEVELPQERKIRWGGAWQISSLGDFEDDLELATRKYIAKKLQENQYPRIDAQHFEIVVHH